MGSRHGKKIWQPFQPYDMRHWCAIARLIETKIQTGTFDKVHVQNWLGHTNMKTTEGYTLYAEMYYNQYQKSWIQSALRSHKTGRGKHKVLQSKGLPTNWAFWPTLLNFSPRSKNGPAQI